MTVASPTTASSPLSAEDIDVLRPAHREIAHQRARLEAMPQDVRKGMASLLESIDAYDFAQPERTAYAVSTRSGDQRRAFVLDEQWEGRIVEVGVANFEARLINVATREVKSVTVPATSVDQQDRNLIAPGAEFYLCIGRLASDVERPRTARLWFRRLPAWTPRQRRRWRRKASAVVKSREPQPA